MTKSGRMLGTVHYMAPEQVEGAHVDHRADVFSVGAIAYELVAGKPMFEGRTTRGLLQDKLTRRLPPPHEIGPGISPELHDLLAQGLQNEPENRLASLAAIASWSGELDPEFLQGLFVP